MTRHHTRQPVWAWRCDSCGIEHSTLAFEQRKLPTPDEMRAAGWYIAPLFGDRCPGCNDPKPGNSGEASS